jgi:NADPH2:quinone reductase
MHASHSAALRVTLAGLIDHVANGRLRIRADLQLPLSQAAEAYRLIENRMTSGKAVLPWAD